MSQKGRMKNFLIPGIMICFLYLVFKYQDTDSFQNTLNFLFNPDPEYALPLVWQENRMLFLAASLVATIIWYKPTWKSYKNIIKIYRDSPVVTKRPNISALQASYFFRQEQVSCLVTWLLEMCNNGAVSLHFKNESMPWSLQKKSAKSISLQDKELLTILFRNKDIIVLRAPLSDPIPEVKETAEELFKRATEKYRLSFHARQNSLPGWLVLLVLIGEIPFYMASQDAHIIGTLPVTIFSTAVCIAPVYVFCRYLPTFFQGPHLIAGISMTLSLLFVLFAHSLMYSHSSTASYWATALYPNIVAVLLTLLYMAPLLPINCVLLKQIVGYQKYLAGEGYSTQEKDLPWTLGLGIHADIIDSSFRYGSLSTPIWLENYTDKDGQSVMKRLHQTFATSVNKAVYGENDNRRHGNRSIGRRR